jgi:hypothetical protein
VTGGVFDPDAGTVRFGDDAATIRVLIAPQATVLGTGAGWPETGAVVVGLLEAMVVAARVTFGWEAATDVVAAVPGFTPALVAEAPALAAALAARNLAISSLNSFSGSLIKALMSCCA